MPYDKSLQERVGKLKARLLVELFLDMTAGCIKERSCRRGDVLCTRELLADVRRDLLRIDVLLNEIEAEEK